MVYRHLGGWSVDVGLKEEGRGSMVAMVALWWVQCRSYCVGGLGYFVDSLGESSAMGWLFFRLRWQVLGYVVVLVGESSAIAIWSTSVASPRLSRRACWRVPGYFTGYVW